MKAYPHRHSPPNRIGQLFFIGSKPNTVLIGRKCRIKLTMKSVFNCHETHSRNVHYVVQRFLQQIQTYKKHIPQHIVYQWQCCAVCCAITFFN